MKAITFNYRCMIQARFISMLSRRTGEDILDLAIRFGERLANKIDAKYRTIYPLNKRRTF